MTDIPVQFVPAISVPLAKQDASDFGPTCARAEGH